MHDQRLDELLGRINEKGSDGQPSFAAQFAAKVKGYLAEIEVLRKELNSANAEVSEMELRSAAMTASLADRNGLRDDLVYEAQDASVRAAMSSYAGDSGGLKKVVDEKRALIADFDKAHEAEVTRLDRLKLSLTANRDIVRKNRELIAQRMNTISSLVDRAPAMDKTPVQAPQATVPVAGATRMAAPASPSSPAAPTAEPRHGRVRRVRIIRRR